MIGSIDYMNKPAECGGDIMNRICIEIKDYEEIVPELQQVLAQLDDDLIGEGLLWI